MDYIFLIDNSYTAVTRSVTINYVLNDFITNRMAKRDTVSIYSYRGAEIESHILNAKHGSIQEPISVLNYFETDFAPRYTTRVLYNTLVQQPVGSKKQKNRTRIIIITDGVNDQEPNSSGLDEQLTNALNTFVQQTHGTVHILFVSDEDKEQAKFIMRPFVNLVTGFNGKGYLLFNCKANYAAMLQWMEEQFPAVPQPNRPKEEEKPKKMEQLLALQSSIDQKTEEHVLNIVIDILNESPDNIISFVELGNKFPQKDLPKRKGMRFYTGESTKNFLMRHTDKFDLLIDDHSGTERIMLKEELVRKPQIASPTSPAFTVIAPDEPEPEPEPVIEVEPPNPEQYAIESSCASLMKEADDIVREVAYSLHTRTDVDYEMCRNNLELQRDILPDLAHQFQSEQLQDMARNVIERLDHLNSLIPTFLKDGGTQKVKDALKKYQDGLESTYDKKENEYKSNIAPFLCPSCSKDLKEFALRPCGHSYCRECLQMVLLEHDCPVCHVGYTMYEKL